MQDLDRFKQLFVGGQQAHGRLYPGVGGKGRAKTRREAAPPETYREHLAGGVGLGLVPVRADGTCRFAAIDIDIDTIDHAELLKKVLARRLPLVVCRSKSGGAHLYLFTKEPGLPATQVIQTLKKWATLLGYPSAEIFPKQTKIAGRDCGNWINLPYFGDGHTTRCALGPHGRLSLGEFLDAVEFYDPARCDADETPLPEPAEPAAPEVPILANGKITEGRRNEKLTSIAGSMRRRVLGQKAIEAALLAHNRDRCEPPLPEREVSAIAASVARYPSAASAESHNLTDVGNAERFVEQHGENIRSCPKLNRWFTWDRRRFCRDEEGRIDRLARDTARAIFNEATKTEDQDLRAKVAKWGLRSEFEPRLRAMVSLARSWQGVTVTPDEFDADPMLLNCQRGTLDLRTGALREHRRADLITKVVPVAYDPAAECPRFREFLDRIMGGNQSMIDYLRRLAGYFLTGSTRERCFFLGYGAQGDNGKTTLAELLRQLLGDYGQAAEISTFLEQKNERVRDDLADLAGARLVCGIEVPANKLLAEALMKQLTGGEDCIKARPLYGRYFQYKPQFKILLMANHKPVIRGTDNAIWNRVHLIPFDVVIPKEEQDRELLAKLRREFPGILAWAVGGCLEWQERGLDAPAEVLAATADYRVEMDKIGAFLTERCVVNYKARVGVGELYADYVRWSGQDHYLGRTNFGQRLKERDFKQERVSHGGPRRWVGLGLLTRVGESEGRDEL